MGKAKNSFSQFDKGSGSSSAGDIGKTIIVSVVFGITAVLSFILIVLSFTQVQQQGKFTWAENVDICELNTTKAPIKFIVPKVASSPSSSSSSSSSEAPTDAPTVPPATDAPPPSALRYYKEEWEEVRKEREVEEVEEEEEWDLGATNPNQIYNKYFSKKQVVECPWEPGTSGTRILAHVLGLFTCLAVFILVMKCEYWQAFWFCLVSCLVLVVFIFIVFVRDATTLGDVRKYCENMASDLTNDKTINPDSAKITCDLTTHIAVGVLNIIWLLWVVNAGLLYVYVKKWKVVIYS